MDNAVYTFEQILHQSLEAQGTEELCKTIQRCQDRVLKVKHMHHPQTYTDITLLSPNSIQNLCKKITVGMDHLRTETSPQRGFFPKTPQCGEEVAFLGPPSDVALILSQAELFSCLYSPSCHFGHSFKTPPPGAVTRV